MAFSVWLCYWPQSRTSNLWVLKNVQINKAARVFDRYNEHADVQFFCSTVHSGGRHCCCVSTSWSCCRVSDPSSSLHRRGEGLNMKPQQSYSLQSARSVQTLPHPDRLLLHQLLGFISRLSGETPPVCFSILHGSDSSRLSLSHYPRLSLSHPLTLSPSHYPRLSPSHSITLSQPHPLTLPALLTHPDSPCQMSDSEWWTSASTQTFCPSQYLKWVNINSISVITIT